MSASITWMLASSPVSHYAPTFHRITSVVRGDAFSDVKDGL